MRAQVHSRKRIHNPHQGHEEQKKFFPAFGAHKITNHYLVYKEADPGMTRRKPIAGLATPIIKSDSGIEEERTSILVALFLECHEVDVQEEVVYEDERHHFSFEEEMGESDEAYDENAAKHRHEVVESDEEWHIFTTLVVYDEVYALLEEFVPVEDGQSKYRGLHSEDSEGQGKGKRLFWHVV